MDSIRAGVDRAKCFTAADIEKQVFGQMMLDTSEGIMRDGTIRGRVVAYDFETIVQDQIRAARPAKLKYFAKRVVNPVLKHSDRRVVVL